MTHAANEEQKNKSGSNYVKEIFYAIGIESVYWIDDKFRVDAILSHQEQECIQHLLALKNIDQFDEALALIANDLTDGELTIDGSMPEQAIKSYLELNITDENVESIVKNLGIKSDLLDSEFSKITALLMEAGVDLKQLSWKTWNDGKVDFEKQDKALFIVDHDFSDEQDVALGDGGDIIKPLTKNMPDSSYCFLLTHRIDHGQEEVDFRKSIIDKNNMGEVEQPKFSVVSKKILKPEDFKDNTILGCKFGELVKSISLRRLNVALYDSLRGEVRVQLDELRDDLCQSSTFEIESVVFNSTRGEGASEIYLLRRFIDIKSDNALANVITANTHSDNVRKIRAVQGVVSPKKITALNAYYKRFSEYRNLELFDGYINTINSPISGGDMFELNVGGSQISQFILVAQDCDLALRDEGKRTSAEVTLIPLEYGDIELSSSPKQLKAFYKDEDTSQHTIFLPNSEKKANKLVFKFKKALTVNVNILELCVFNKNGQLKINKSKSNNDNFYHYLPGWNLKYQSVIDIVSASAKAKEKAKREAKVIRKPKVSTKVKNIDEYEALKSGYQYFGLSLPQPKWIDNDFFGISGKRIKRLKSPYRIDLLNKYYSYKSRHAEEHDFTGKKK